MTENGHTFQINPKSTRRGEHGNMVALKRIQNYCYFLTDQIGLGFTSHVYKGKCQDTNIPVAIKVIDRKSNEDQLQKQFLQEQVAVLERIKNADSTNLLKLQCVIRTKNNLYIITEFCQGKDLAKILRKKKKMNEIQAQSIMKQVLNGYKELYNLKIVHRDLKLANLFITKGLVKIADFGFAIGESQCREKMEYNVGSPYYMPPQALKDNQYSYKSDVWGLGVIAYQLVYGRVPWKDKDQHVIYQMMKNCPVQKLFDDNVRLSDQYKNFLKACLTVDVLKRADAEFIINYNWPMAQQHVEGLQKYERSDSIGRPIHKTQMMPIINRNASKQKINQINQTFNREKEANKNRSRSNERPMTPKTNIITNDMPKNFKQIPSKSQQRLSEYALAGQLHYCRFMFQLYRILNRVPEIEKENLQQELKSRIMDKINILKKIVTRKENLLKSPGFTSFVQSQKFQEISRVILKYYEKYEKLFQRYKPIWTKNSQQTLKLILQLKNTHPNQLIALEQLVYYYQIKQLQNKENFHDFYEKSRINYLVDNVYLQDRRSEDQFRNNQIRERLMKKLTYLAIA